MWHETNAQNDGTIKRQTQFPESPEQWVLSGPHFVVGTPFFQTPRAVCDTNRSYDTLDLTDLPVSQQLHPRLRPHRIPPPHPNFSAVVDWPGARVITVKAMDTAGNPGDHASTTATLSQPPDYVLFAKYSEAEQGWQGAFSNALKTKRGTLLVPVDTTETWQDYIDNGYPTTQAEIDAGYPIFAQPGPVSGRYENTVDYGTVLSGSLITVSTTPDLLAGSVQTEMRLSFSENGIDWEEGAVNQMQVFGRNFRFVKVRGDYIGDGDDLIEIEDIQIRLDRKLRSDAGKGRGFAADVGGTSVSFTVPFIDIQHISITPMASEPVIHIVDFQDEPNPIGFNVLFYNTGGERVDCQFSWGAEGF